MKKITKRILGTSLTVPILLFAIFWLTFVKCQTDIHPDLQPYVDEFKDYYEFYLHKKFPEHFLIADFIGNENSDCKGDDCKIRVPEAINKCGNNGCSIRLFIQDYIHINKSGECYRYFLEEENEYYQYYLEFIVYHEMAHLYLDFSNRINYDRDDHAPNNINLYYNFRENLSFPISIMTKYSGDCLNNSSIAFIFNNTRDYYLKELFTGNRDYSLINH